MADQFHTLAFATVDATANGDGLSKPFAVLHTGTFKRGDFGEMKVSEADLDSAVANFKAAAVKDDDGTPEAPVDFDHSFAKGQGSKAAGWIRDLYREGQQLMARVRWTPEATEAINAKQWRYVSPEFTPNWKDEGGKERGFALLASGLTNRPFLKSLPPVALSEEVAEDLAAHARGLAHAAGIELSGEGARTTRKTPAMADEPTVTLTEAEVTTLREQATQVATLTEKVTALEESRDQAVTALDETKATLRKEQVDKLLGQAHREGRIDAGDETNQKWHDRAEKHGVDFVRDLLQEFPAESIPMSERGHGEDKPVEGKAPEGVDQTDFALDQRVKALMTEKSISFDAAFDIVAAEEAAR